MDVRCNRCATEYDFDDALISERGTTVKCTNCGYQFKVFPANAATNEGPERWVVRTRAGREVVYNSLRELQRGIADRQVGPDDLLSRSRKPARALGSIAELEPFFSHAKPSGRPERTLQGVAPAARVQESAIPNASFEPNPQKRVDDAIRELPQETLSLPNAATELARHDDRTRPTRRELGARLSDRVETSEPQPERPAPSPAAPVLTPTPRAELHSRPELRSSPELRPRPELPSSPTLGAPFTAAAPVSTGRRDLRSYDELLAEDLPDPVRRARSRWIAGVVIAGVATLFAITVGRRYLVPAAPPTAQPTASSNAKVAEFLLEGSRLLDDGDFEGAAEQLLRASALGEKDRSVLSALARLETLRADIAWLKLRLLDPQVPELVQTAHRELGRRVGKARTAIDAAFAVAPEDIVVLRARVDALRLSGEADKAREWIKPIASNASDPENAYVLAALDLADSSPSFPGVIDRLRTAANGERSPGRAHVALVYALARAGRLVEAQTEVARLDARPTGAPLLDELKGFLKRHDKLADAGAKSAAAAVDPKSLGKLDTSTTEESRAEAAGSRDSNADFRKLLQGAANALRAGDLARAERLYDQVIAAQPGNTEALAGLGDVARRRNDPEAAAVLYDQVLAENPSYLPALIARADQEWEAGNKKAALSLYRRIVEQASPSTAYAQRAASRIAQSEAAPSDPAKAAAPEENSAPAPAAAPEIDTTDLPELK
jgi:predicted Zn finger-like uncharacterized protein